MIFARRIQSAGACLAPANLRIFCSSTASTADRAYKKVGMTLASEHLRFGPTRFQPTPGLRNVAVVKVAGQWRYVYRAVDQFGQVVDVFVSPRRDIKAARRFFEHAIGTTKVTPVEVVTDHAPVYPGVLEELAPAAWHRTDQDANNRVEADHGRLKARLGPMRGLKQDRSARVVIAGHAFVQNIRRGHDELAAEAPMTRRLAVVFDELARAG